ncbi:hypothetical protein MKX03_004152 [Papaver bracteatum]|nr:hypothetical protein MKX03_004152 [Papaver bracteatum]
MTIVELRVHMDCAGCESKIRKALQKLEGIDDIDVDMSMQKVTVTGYADQKRVLKTVRKTGRRAELWPPYDPEYDSYSNVHNHHYYNQSQNPVPTTHHYQSSGQHHHGSLSSYNYQKHGYDSYADHGYYHNRPAHSNVIDDRTGSMFSDENPNACSIM